MNFTNTQYLPHIIAGSIFLIILFGYLNQKYFNWVKTYWFFERSWMSRLSSLVYFLSIFLILGSLLDLRGPEEKVKTSLPDQKTIIILDSSASMLAEDVRPSRYSKAIQIARHFVKSAAGHQISIVLFSDVQKKLIPFTDDIDLLDSRLAALEKSNSVSGGSNISQAIAEAVGYFDSDEDQKAASGNILVFTDAEEGEDAFDVELGDKINLAVIGIGTAKGGNIPLRWEDGSFRGYKNSKGQPVVTKLDEEYIRKLGKNVKNYKYWIANSYSLPTEDILNFFKGNYNKIHGKGDVRIRPVFSHLILIPAIILYCLSIILGRFASFKTVMSFLLVSLLFTSSSAIAKDEKKPVQKELPAALLRDMEKMKSGKADRKEILKIAENLLKNNENDKAKALYTEYAKADDDQEVIFNRATALLKVGELDQAMPYIQQIFKTAKTEKMKDEMRHNILMAMNSEGKEKGKDKDKEEKEDEEKEKNKEDKKEDEKGEEDDKGEGKKEGKNKEGEGKEGKDSKSGNNPGQNQKNKEDKEGKEKEEDKKKEPKDLEPPPRPEPKDLEGKENDIKKRRRMTQTPAMVKQILSDDRELQKKMMDTSTDKRGSQKEKRDW